MELRSDGVKSFHNKQKAIEHLQFTSYKTTSDCSKCIGVTHFENIAWQAYVSIQNDIVDAMKRMGPCMATRLVGKRNV